MNKIKSEKGWIFYAAETTVDVDNRNSAGGSGFFRDQRSEWVTDPETGDKRWEFVSYTKTIWKLGFSHEQAQQRCKDKACKVIEKDRQLTIKLKEKEARREANTRVKEFDPILDCPRSDV